MDPRKEGRQSKGRRITLGRERVQGLERWTSGKVWTVDWMSIAIARPDVENPCLSLNMEGNTNTSMKRTEV